MHSQTILLENERKKVSFYLKPLTLLLYGDEETYNFAQKFYSVAEGQYPELNNKIDFYNKSRKEQFLSKVPQVSAVDRITKQLGAEIDDSDKYIGIVIYGQQTQYMGVFFSMVMPAIKILGSDEQVQLWLNDCKNLKILGCYAQTELGHGSDVQNLQTTATYNQDDQSFILHTPSIEAIKYWPGDLGLLANYALVFAQLIVKGQNHGVQAFMVQIRDQVTHKPLPGVTVGDIGPKGGYQTKDNGYLKLNKVSVPRINMLNRYVQVRNDGLVSRSGNPKVQYSAMMVMRRVLVYIYPRMAQISLTTAIRYSIIRQQFKNDQGIENQVLDYQAQQDKLFPLLAQSYAVIFSGIILRDLVEQNFRNVQEGTNFSLLPVSHALLSGAKPYFTNFVIHCSEWCRLSCGGHGFAYYSGLPQIYQENSPNVTLEGENQIMYLQLARYLLKMLNYAYTAQDKISSQFNIFKDLTSIIDYKCVAQTPDDFKNVQQLLNLLKCSFIKSIISVGETLLTYKQTGLSLKQIVDQKLGIYLVECAKFFMDYYTFDNFLTTTGKCDDQNCKCALQTLLQLYGLQLLIEQSSNLVEHNIVGQKDLKLIKLAKEELFPIIRKDAIGYVDAFQIPDSVLKSTIGCYDGKAYERTFEWVTKENSMNNQLVKKGIFQLKQMKAKL